MYVSVGFGYGWAYSPFWGPCGMAGPCFYSPNPWDPWGPTYYSGYYGPYAGATVVDRPAERRPFDRRHGQGDDFVVGSSATGTSGQGGSGVSNASAVRSPAAAQGRRVRKTSTDIARKDPATAGTTNTHSVRGAPTRRTVKMHPVSSSSTKSSTRSTKSVRRTRKSSSHPSVSTRTYSPPRIQSSGSGSSRRSSGTSRSSGSKSRGSSTRRKK